MSYVVVIVPPEGHVSVFGPFDAVSNASTAGHTLSAATYGDYYVATLQHPPTV